MEVFLVLYLAVIVLMVVSLWKIFEKAGEPGWAALVPFYNMYLLTTSVAGKEALWFFLLFIPLVNIVVVFMIYVAVAERFGKGAAFGIGMIFLPFVFFPLLAFGDAEHESQARGGRRRSRDRDYGDYDDDRPRKKKSRYEDDADDRPRRSRRDEVDEVEDDAPRKKRRPVEDDEDDRPARRRRRDDD